MGESYFWKPFAQGVATPIVLIGGTNLLLKDFKVSNPYLYWGGLAASSAIVVGILADKIKVPILNAEGDSWDGTTGDDFRKYDDMELTEDDHEILVEEIERGFENFPADTLRNAKASAVSQINWFGIDKSHGDYDAETFEGEANYMKQGFDIQREGSSHVAIYYIIKGDNHIMLDYDRRTDYGNRPNAREYPYDYGEQDFSTLQEALNWFDKQIENGRVFTDFGTNPHWNAEYDEEDMVYCNHCWDEIGNEKEVYGDETVDYEMANGELVCIPCHKIWMKEYKNDLDPHYSPFYAETLDNEKNKECKYCWNELMNAVNFGNTRCGHCGKTPAENKAKEKKGNKRPLKKNESERHIDINLRDEKVIIGLRPLVGDYWGKPVKTRQNPHALGWGDRYCGIHEKPMTEGFRKGVDKGRHIYKCDECYFHELIPPKAKMDWEEVKKVLKPYHY